MRKEDLKAGYVLVFGSGRKRVIAPVLYQDKETLALFDNITDSCCQQIFDYDPFEDGVVEVWGVSDTPSQSMTTNLDERKLLWKKEVPVKVTGDERVILANLPDKYFYIARDADGRLFLYGEKPELFMNKTYRGVEFKEMNYITKLPFDCIKPLTCHKMSDLL